MRVGFVWCATRHPDVLSRCLGHECACGELASLDSPLSTSATLHVDVGGFRDGILEGCVARKCCCADTEGTTPESRANSPLQQEHIVSRAWSPTQAT